MSDLIRLGETDNQARFLALPQNLWVQTCLKPSLRKQIKAFLNENTQVKSHLRFRGGFFEYDSGMSAKTINEVEIWNGIINPDRRDMSAPEANAVLRWCFNDEAKSMMEALAVRNGRGELSEAEREQLEACVNPS